MPQEKNVGAAHAFWLVGRQVTGEDSFDVTSPWDGRLVGKVSVPTDAQVEEAVAAAYAVRDEFAATPAHVRAAALDHVSKRLVERTEEIARLISAENGKPIKWARGEVGRAVSVFRFAAEEARRFNGGEAQRLDTDAAWPGAARPHPALPEGGRARHRAVQLPAEPVRPQDRPGDRGRCADHPQAGPGDPAVRPDHR